MRDAVGSTRCFTLNCLYFAAVAVAAIAVAPSWADEGSDQGAAPIVISTGDSVFVAIETPAEETGDVPVDNAVASAEPAADASNDEQTAVATPTHHQTTTIDVNGDGRSQLTLTSFGLTPDDRILACCKGSAGEIRVFNSAGEYQETWSAPFQPDAIGVRADGAIFLAGEGKLAKLSADGQVEYERPAPHASEMDLNRDKIREDVIAQAERMKEVYARQAGQYDKMLKQAEKQIADTKQQIADLVEADEKEKQATEDDSDTPATGRSAMRKEMLERRLTMQEKMKGQYDQAKEQWDKMVAQQNKQPELTEEQIDKKVEASIQYKLKASSICALEGQVFLATHAAVGYGFEVWRMDDQFSGGERIISGLSGCCGQMDVKANDDGLFVAENSRHRVCRYDHDGELICNWGHGSREGLKGFGSCCNPMNVAFDADGGVYTSEDDTGRIKRYSADGKLLGLIGAVDLVPGCKNVSIAVNSDASRVYMMDITRNRILQMEPYGPGEAPAPKASDLDEGSKSAIVEGVKAIFGLAD